MTDREPTLLAREWVSQLDLPDVGLVARIVRLDLLVTRVLDELASAEGITPADHVVLGVLRRSPGCQSAPSRMCELLGRSSGGMSLTIDRLEASGWLTRAPDPEDRRRIVVTLTADGLDVTTRVNDALHEWERTLELDAGQRAETIGLVDRLLDLFEDAASRSPAVAPRRT
jgi:DNA-binding MarR family transcriptional regulator